ncbi:hypothetical protein FA15DRAFT_711453 [Coprinopsis marcescibilis]|uniref:Uncharacterized protein n=1 Tax=Coprinopsis marcescibilis TaxID=230819 RepID=A0A5C3K9Z0_COPMA|nr:hypothetical protein FA15DRAFT_711453 [Coprinopsis marcescibilis]
MTSPTVPGYFTCALARAAADQESTGLATQTPETQDNNDTNDYKDDPDSTKILQQLTLTKEIDPNLMLKAKMARAEASRRDQELQEQQMGMSGETQQAHTPLESWAQA